MEQNDDVELLMMEVTGDHVDKCGLLFFQVQDRSVIYSPIQGREDAANVMKMEMLFVIVLMLGQWDMSLNHFGRTHVKYKVFERMQKRLFMSSFQAKFSVWGRPSTPEQS